MSLRLDFVHEALLARTPFAELCARYGVSEKSGYKWKARFLAEGPAGLADRSHAPHHVPHRLASALEELLRAARRAHPTWGARKLRVVLAAAHPTFAWPAASTLTAALGRAGLLAARPRRPPSPAHPAVAMDGGGARTPAAAPNDVWSVDFKGEFRTGDGRYCYPLTVVDGASRLLLACRARGHISGAETRATCTHLFRRHGLPRAIRSDNGAPFASPTAVRGLSRLAVWWLRLGITPERGRPGCPQDNGAHERLHRTLKAEATRPPAATGAAQQRRFDAFRREYNTVRPHEALGQVPPATRYTPSPRPYPARLPPAEYPAAWERRGVGSDGGIGWQGARVFLTESLAGEAVGLTRVDEAQWAVYFLGQLLGYLVATPTPRRGDRVTLVQLPQLAQLAPLLPRPASPILPV